MAESQENDSKKSQQPLHQSQTASGRLQNIEEDEKQKSALSLSRSLFENSDGEFRRRSRSAPMTLEVAKVASELKRLSDSLHRTYSASKGKKQRSRRHTFDVPGEKDDGKRKTFHFDYGNYEENGSIPLDRSGTSV